MKSSILIFRTIVIIILIAGGAHIFSYKSSNNDRIPKRIKLQNSKSDGTLNSTSTNNLIGIWKASYNSNEYKGSIIYRFISEGEYINAYLSEDENGYNENLIISIKKFDGLKGEGTYFLTHEKEKYKIKCDIKLVNKTKLIIRYDYYGFNNNETWVKQ